MKHILQAAVAAAALLILCPGTLSANKQTQSDDRDPLEMSFEENIASPAVPNKLHETIKANVRSNAAHLRKHGYNVSTQRSGEVLCVTIPCEQLFAANATTLMPNAYNLLKALGAYLQQPQLYKMIVAVYSDDTGSEEYADALTDARVAAIDDYLMRLGGEDALVVPYGMGCDNPVADNRTRINRSKNRRVEIYLVPDKALFRKVK